MCIHAPSARIAARSIYIAPDDVADGTFSEWTVHMAEDEIWFGIWVTVADGQVTEIEEMWCLKAQRMSATPRIGTRVLVVGSGFMKTSVKPSTASLRVKN